MVDPGFPRGGHRPIIQPNFPENCVKMKKIGLREGTSKISLHGTAITLSNEISFDLAVVIYCNDQNKLTSRSLKYRDVHDLAIAKSPVSHKMDTSDSAIACTHCQ